MTDTTHEAPERIWADGNAEWESGSWGLDKEFDNDVEYVRADLVQAAVAAERERCARVAENLKVDDPHWQICGDFIVRRQVAAAIREGGE